MREVVETLSERGSLPPLDELRGVPAAALDEWERELGAPLPNEYRQFMELAGACTDAELFCGSTFFWPHAREIRDWAQANLKHADYDRIPSEALVVLEHQGYIFIWLDTRVQGTPVYVLYEGATPADSRVERIASTFREWILSD